MLSLILFLQEADTLKGKGEVYEVREETSKGKSEASETRDETFKFLAGQALLGCAAYPPAVSFFLLALDQQENVATCAACITPIACLGTSATLALTSPLKKPVAISSFTGALDGMLWSALIIANIYVNFSVQDLKIAATLFLFGLAGGNGAGYLAGYGGGSGGGSEGAYVLKTISAVQLLWAYFQTLRIIYGDKLTQLSDLEIKLHLAAATTLSIGGGLGTFALNVNDYDITAGDALFIGSNTLKGALILSAPITTAYLLSQPKSIPFSGFYLDPVLGRLDGVANLAGAFLGAYISYRIAKKEDLSLLEGIVYSVVPAFAYWAALAPTIVSEEYYRISPMFQVAFDVGTSILIYRLTKTF